mgnify:CR=1 FL=1
MKMTKVKFDKEKFIRYARTYAAGLAMVTVLSTEYGCSVNTQAVVPTEPIQTTENPVKITFFKEKPSNQPDNCYPKCS